MPTPPLQGLLLGVAGTHYKRIEDEMIHAQLWEWLEGCNKLGHDGNTEIVRPRKSLVGEVVEALIAAAQLDLDRAAPAWMGPSNFPHAEEFTAVGNGFSHFF